MTRRWIDAVADRSAPGLGYAPDPTRPIGFLSEASYRGSQMHTSAEATAAYSAVRFVGRPDPFAALCDRLNALLALPGNWDSYGARPVDPTVAVQAAKILQLTMREETPRPAIVPTTDGGLQVEWHVHGIDLEVEILASGHLAVSFEDARRGTKWDKELGSDLTPLVDCIKALYVRE
jgi:hypothetical protein